MDRRSGRRIYTGFCTRPPLPDPQLTVLVSTIVQFAPHDVVVTQTTDDELAVQLSPEHETERVEFSQVVLQVAANAELAMKTTTHTIRTVLTIAM